MVDLANQIASRLQPKRIASKHDVYCDKHHSRHFHYPDRNRLYHSRLTIAGQTKTLRQGHSIASFNWKVLE
jgi:hypothetical protein